MRRSALWIAAIVVLAAACWPVTTRFGVDYHWSSRTITLFEKAVHFVSRDLETRRLVAELTRGAASRDERLRRLFNWTVEHVRSVPPGMPIVDDHVLNIIIRGYGAADQRTEAFALLASYAGFPATAVPLYAPGTERRLLVAVVRDGTRTLVFDVNHGVAFRDQHGRFADVRELSARPDLVPETARSLVVDGIPYTRYLNGLAALEPSFDRMEAQKPWPRLKQEVGHLFSVKPTEATR